VLDISLKIGGLRAIIECPTESRRARYSDARSLQISCTMQLSCPPLSKEARSLEDYRHQNYQMHEYNPEAGAMCEIKLKINVVRNLTVSETREDNPCTGFAYREHLLLPHSTNCSLVSLVSREKK
jgi:hypothetical protein